MGSQTDDGRHEGVVEFVFADGTSGASWSAGPIATTRPDGTELEEWQHRRDEEVVGWRVRCTDLTTSDYRHCWTGSLWTRVSTEAQQDLTARRIHSSDSMLATALDRAVMADWYAHIAPSQSVYPVELAADAVATAQERLTEAVQQARGDGASWEAIGKAAGMTRQSAHERWARITG